MADEYGQLARQYTPGVLTGKPVEVGGSLGRKEATSRGCFYVTRETAKLYNFPLEEARIAIQGCGNVGGQVARIFHKQGYRVTAICDISGGLYHPDGLDIPALLEHVRKTGLIEGFSGGEKISSEELLTLDCDILIPAAMENQLTAANAAEIKARCGRGGERAHYPSGGADRGEGAVLVTVSGEQRWCATHTSNGCRTGRAITGMWSR